MDHLSSALLASAQVSSKTHSHTRVRAHTQTHPHTRARTHTDLRVKSSDFLLFARKRKENIRPTSSFMHKQYRNLDSAYFMTVVWGVILSFYDPQKQAIHATSGETAR